MERPPPSSFPSPPDDPEPLDESAEDQPDASAAPPDDGKKPPKKRKAKEKLGVPPIGSPDVPRIDLDEAYEVVLMDRRQLSDYPENPRSMTPEKAANLREGLKAVRFLRPICTWNKRNGKLVSGHQRLRAVDKIAKGMVYMLNVCVVDMDEAAHAAACVLDNNGDAQGDFEFDRLVALMSKPGIKREATGWSADDWFNLFGETGAAVQAGEQAMQVSAAMEKAQERQTNLVKGFSTRDSPDFYDVVVYNSEADRQAAHDLWGFGFTKTGAPTVFHDGAELLRSQQDFLAWRSQNPERTAGQRGLGAARLLVELVDPLKAGTAEKIAPGDLAAIKSYLEQALKVIG